MRSLQDKHKAKESNKMLKPQTSSGVKQRKGNDPERDMRQRQEKESENAHCLKLARRYNTQK